MLDKTQLSMILWMNYVLLRQHLEQPPPATQQPLPRRKQPLFAQQQAQVRFIDDLRNRRMA